MNCVGIVSLADCNDVIVHLDRDMDRLYALHQTVVHPAKHVAYTAFWIRKIKPVSYAWPLDAIQKARAEGGDVDEGLEQADINERICLQYLCHQICVYVESGQISTPQPLSAERYAESIRRTFIAFVEDKLLGPH